MTESDFFRMVHEYATEVGPDYLYKHAAREPLSRLFSELQRYREREPLVQALIGLINMDEARWGMPGTRMGEAWMAVHDFRICDSSATETRAATEIASGESLKK